MKEFNLFSILSRLNKMTPSGFFSPSNPYKNKRRYKAKGRLRRRGNAGRFLDRGIRYDYR